MKEKDTASNISKSSRFNKKAMILMNITAITIFILAIIYKIWFSK